jgi:Ran GTPase-activating protein (RanGAP) involved in mRNA processing and transport
VSLIAQNNQNLQHLLINSSGFDLNGLISLTSRLYENQGLVSLSLDRPILSKTKQGEVTEHMSKVLLQHRSLAYLSMKYHSINDHGAKLLSDSLNVTQTLLSLNLECNSIGVAGAEALASNLLIQENRCLQFLGMSFNFVSDDGAIALADVSHFPQNGFYSIDND